MKKDMKWRRRRRRWRRRRRRGGGGYSKLNTCMKNSCLMWYWFGGCHRVQLEHL